MSFWNAMNWVAWGLCGVIFVLITRDFIKVELEQAAKKTRKSRVKESVIKAERPHGTN
jgi:hypothetical protein